MTLSQEKCEACRAGGTPLTPDAARTLAADAPLWTLLDARIEREFTCRDFRAAIAFVNQVADIAEAEGHHPDICIDYRRVRLTLWTKKIGGLSRNDFIVAAKIDQLAASSEDVV